MKKVLLLFLLLISLPLFAEDVSAKNFAGVEKFTVTTVIYPHALYAPVRDAVIAELKKIGDVVIVESSEDEASSMVQTTMLKFSIENRIQDTKKASQLEFSVNVNFVLESVSNQKVVWGKSEEVSFSPKGDVLIGDGVKAAKKLAIQFSEMYAKSNPNNKGKPTFYVL